MTVAPVATLGNNSVLGTAPEGVFEPYSRLPRTVRQLSGRVRKVLLAFDHRISNLNVTILSQFFLSVNPPFFRLKNYQKRNEYMQDDRIYAKVSVYIQPLFKKITQILVRDTLIPLDKNASLCYTIHDVFT